MGLSKVPSAGLAPSANILTWLALTNSGSAAPWVKLCTISGNQNDRGSIVLSGSASYSANDDSIAGGATINFTLGNDSSVNNLNLQVTNSSNQNTLVLAAYVVKGATDFIWDLWIKTQEYARINAFAFGNVYTITATYTDITTTTKPTGGYDKKVGRDVSSLTPGTVLQVVSFTTNSSMSTSATSFVDIGLEATITLANATNKVMVDITVHAGGTEDARFSFLKLLRNGVSTVEGNKGGSNGTNCFGVCAGAGSGRMHATEAYSFNYVDTPGASGAITYKIQVNPNATASGRIFYLNRPHDLGDALRGWAVSTITLTEIAG